MNRLIRISFGPFQLGDLGDSEVQEIRGRVLRDQLGERLVTEADLDFDAPIVNQMDTRTSKQNEQKKKRKSSGGAGAGWISAKDAAAVLAKNKSKPVRQDRDKKDGEGSEQNPFGDRKRIGVKPPLVTANQLKAAASASPLVIGTVVSASHSVIGIVVSVSHLVTGIAVSASHSVTGIVRLDHRVMAATNVVLMANPAVSSVQMAA